MSPQKVKFVTGFGSFGGSTVALLEHCRLLEEHGFEVFLYADGSWHMDRFRGSKKISEFYPEKDDIVVFHHLSPKVRPKCRRSILYVHEKSLWPIKGRSLLSFDVVAYVSDDQFKFHGVPGVVVPNPVGRMVDPSRHHPPGRNIAGVVGTIQKRKRQHVSIERALADGREKVLLFGDFEESYFREKVEPMLSERVVYMGMCDPENRMEMYNSFDYLYMFSEEESASLALGECRILGKDVFKSEEVVEYELAEDAEIVAVWKSIFEDYSPVIKSHAVMPAVDCERLVCVVTHDRKECVSRWLRAWNNSERCGAKVAVLHACDSEDPPEDQKENILAHHPDFYIPFKNSPLRDMGALRIVIRDAAGLPEWKQLFWFTDDLIPMRKDFLVPFVRKLKDEVGLVAQCYEPIHESYEALPGHGCLPHIRTVGYALSREAADTLVFPEVGEDRDKPYLFEHGRVGLYENHILKQVTDNGFDLELCHSQRDSYVHWTETLDWMWDCHFFSEGANIRGRNLSARQMWDLYEAQFERSDSDSLLVFSPMKCERSVMKGGKISAVIPTFSSPMNCFMWSVFSVILRSDPSVLNHLFISINGPDEREGDHDLQDRKQKFIEELRSLNWPWGPGLNPGAITLTRTWSRIGHAQALEQSIPWIDTEFYLSMHDDVIVMDSSWCDLGDFVRNKNLVMKTWGNHIMGKMRKVGDRLEMPHLNTIFTLCNKPMMTGLGVRWNGFCLEEGFGVDEYVDSKDMEGYHRRLGSIENGTKLDGRFGSAGLDIGAFFFSSICSRGLDFGRFAPGTIRHFESASWKPGVVSRILEVEELEKEIFSIKPYGELYSRHMDHG